MQMYGKLEGFPLVHSLDWKYHDPCLTSPILTFGASVLPFLGGTTFGKDLQNSTLALLELSVI